MTRYACSRSAVHAASGRSGAIGLMLALAVVAMLLATPSNAAERMIVEDDVVFQPGYVVRQDP
jgi:hypothetical protein